LNLAGFGPEDISAPGEVIETGIPAAVSDSSGGGTEDALEDSLAADSVQAGSVSGSEQAGEHAVEPDGVPAQSEETSGDLRGISLVSRRDRADSRWRSLEAGRQDSLGELSGSDQADLSGQAEPSGRERPAGVQQAGLGLAGQSESEEIVQAQSPPEDLIRTEPATATGSITETVPEMATPIVAGSEIEETVEESCLEIFADRGFYINIASGGRTLLDDHLSHGDRRTLYSNLPFVVVSLTDRHAVSMTLDGVPVDLAVTPGREIYNHTIPQQREAR
jgi:hypothetical protein